ncbi:MAG: methyltransferase domain-containing protein [Candidatus Latescibacteria bacterium]|nr:methyltransferase domain-containing protein [bacterium]MBD3424243.1 methyltransferase domain-containing protein [Candidatus Latescibacterota bacterium]
MTGTGPFDKYPDLYEQWFEKNEYIYRSELKAVKRMLPGKGRGLEIGVGSGRFAAPAGIRFGVEPSAEMRALARERGLEVIDGTAENLPLDDETFDYVLMVTTVCFLDDIEAAFAEACRVLKPGGCFIAGLVDRESRLGRLYQDKKDKSRFYGAATFFSAGEILSYLERAGFGDFSSVQTIFRDLKEIDSPEPVREGFGEGSFVVIRGIK